MTYPLSVLLATLHVIGVRFAAWLMFLVGIVRWENQTLEDAAANDWLAALAPILLLLAVLVLASVMLRRRRWAAIALAAEAIVASTVIVYALRESVHSDNKHVWLALGVLGAGYAAVALCARPSRSASASPAPSP